MDPRELSPADLYRIEMEARRMRAQAIRSAFSGLWLRLRGLGEARGAARAV
jgi:hypothetical protein